MNLVDNAHARILAAIGVALAAPSFVLNVIAHGGTMPGPDEMDRLDGAFSLMFMAGAAFVVAALFTVKPSPLGRIGRRLLVVEAVMVMLAAIWALLLTFDPGIVREDVHPLVLICDACWPLHQVFMIAVGIAAARAGRWPSPERFTLFGPTIGLLLLGAGVASGTDLLAAVGISLGWTIAGAGVVSVTSERRPASSRDESESFVTIAAP